jgi:hypothetical protein
MQDLPRCTALVPLPGSCGSPADGQGRKYPKGLGLRSRRGLTADHHLNDLGRHPWRPLPGMAIARFPSIVIDCSDPGALATLYGAMLDWKVDTSSDWVEVRAECGQCISFQHVQDYTPPAWPTQEVP